MIRLCACVIVAMGAFSVNEALGQAAAGATLRENDAGETSPNTGQPPAAPKDAGARQPPPPPAEPERPRLALVGTVIGKPKNVALVLDQTTKTLVRLHVGEAASGWFLRSVDSRTMTVEKNSQTVTLALPAHGSGSMSPSAVAEQPGDAISAASPAPKPVGDEDRPGIGTSREHAVPVVAQTEPRSGSEPAPPQLQAGPLPVPESRQALNVPPAAAIATPPLAEAPRATLPEPTAPGRIAALQPTIELLPASGSPSGPSAPPEPAPSAAAIATPPPAPSASEQPADVTAAISPAPKPAGDEDRPGIDTSLELPAVPAIAPTGPRAESEPAPPQLQAGPSPAPESRQALNLPPAAAIATPPLTEASRATPPEPAAPLGNVLQLLPGNAPIRVLVSYAPRSAAARQEAAGVVRLLRGGGLAASDPAPAARVAGKDGITYFFAEDRDGARRVEHDLGEGFGPSRLSPPAPGEPFPRPGTIEVLVSAR